MLKINDDIIRMTDMIKPRAITKKLQDYWGNFPVVALCGARQVGKSTLVKEVFPETEYFLLDSSLDLGGIKSDPDLFLDNHPAPLILDEIQFSPELVSAIKRRVDRDRKPGLYLLTGSQQWAVMKSLSDSLAGRVLLLTLEGFSLAELYLQTEQTPWLHRWLENPEGVIETGLKRHPADRTLYEQLWRGWLPQANTLPLDIIAEFHRSYFQTYVQRDVRAFSELADYRDFGRFVQLLASLTANEINYSQLGREIGITPQTAQRWIQILSATFQWVTVPAYHGNAIKRLSSKPKGYLTDTGLACALQMISTPKTLSGHPQLGSLFETAVFGEIRKQCHLLATPPAMYHWRSYGGTEVDLILERDGVLYPIEVKLTTNPSRKDTSGISAFRKTYPGQRIAPGLVISACLRFEPISKDDFALPWDSV